MRPVRADTELKLKQQLVGVAQACITPVAVLRANLAELARPVRQDNGLLRVLSLRADQPVRFIDSHPSEPAPSELVFPGSVIAEHLAQTERLLAVVPHQLGTGNEGVIDRPRQ